MRHQLAHLVLPRDIQRFLEYAPLSIEHHLLGDEVRLKRCRTKSFISEGHAMSGQISARCPVTAQAIVTDVACDNDSFVRIPFLVATEACPACGGLDLETGGGDELVLGAMPVEAGDVSWPPG